MPISIIINDDLVESVNGSSVKGVNGVWINTDVKVFIPNSVLEMCNVYSEEQFISQEDAQEMFLELEKLQKYKPLGPWEHQFMTSLTEWFDSGMKFSKKQKAKIKSIWDSYSDDIKAAKATYQNEEQPIPF